MARGIETHNFVKDILGRYEHYKNIVNTEVKAEWKPIEEFRLASWQ